jgi:hypothetical protein
MMLLTMWALLALLAGNAAGQSKSGGTTTSPDTSGDAGFRVRVVEEGSGSGEAAAAAERVRRQADRARQEALEASRQHARTHGQAPVPPEPPEPPTEIEFDTGDNNVVRFGEDITIPEGKVIDGDVVAIGGDVTVLGRVKGDCVSVGGAVHVKGKGVVEGDAVSMGGGVTTSDSGSVAGSNVSLGSLPDGSTRHFWPMVGMFGAVGTGIWLLTTMVKLLLTLFFAWLALLLLREPMVAAVETMTQRFGKSFLWGLLGWAAMVIAIPTGIVVLVLVSVIAIAILAITIIGIPLAILLVIALVLGIAAIIVGSLLAVFVGFLNGAMYLGQRILGPKSQGAVKPLLAILVGLALIFVLDFAGDLLQLVGVLVFHPIAIALGIASGALAAILTTSGFGAMILNRFAGEAFATVVIGTGSGKARSQWWGASKPAPSSPPPPGATPPPAGTPPPTSTAPPADGTSDAP